MATNTGQIVATELDWRIAPTDLVMAWPRDVPMLALASGGGGERGRWSIFARGDGPMLDTAGGEEPFSALDARSPGAPHALPFVGGLIGVVEYEAGYLVEPSGAGDRQPGAALFRRCDAAYLHDHLTSRWWLAGSAAGVNGLRALGLDGSTPPTLPRRFIAGRLRSEMGRSAYEARVATITERIRDGAVYQVNLAHRLTARFRGSPRALFARLLASAEPTFGALLEDWRSPTDRRAIVSMSPELFLDIDLADGRRITTRPIKGTRSVSAAGPARPRAELLASEKDAAELAMIVDLMRNDLGRVCEFGSVCVDVPREVEAHAGGSLLHTVATVTGRLRAGLGVGSALGATFPPGSVTGAPKVAAMRAISELELGERGAYCGAVGFISDSGVARLSVAIRTATVEGRASAGDGITGRLVFPVGAGIVAESDPAREWEETLTKARAFGRALRSVRRGEELPA